MSEGKRKLVLQANGISAYHGHIKRKMVTIVLLIIATAGLMVLSLNAGAADLTFSQLIQILLGQGDARSSLVVWNIRLPRVLAALIAGAGLSVAGCVMQNILKNPLASPSTLGISSAAAFGANVAIIVLGAGTILHTAGDAVAISNPYLVTICAFLSALAATLIIMGLSGLRGFSPYSVVLAGVALGAVFTAGTTVIQYFGPDIKVAAAVFWTFGDLGRASWYEVGIMSIIVVSAIVYFYFKRWDYNALASGEETAKSLGVNTKPTRFVGLLVSSLITAVAVSFLGMIGFIGLLGPHMMRRILGKITAF